MNSFWTFVLCFLLMLPGISLRCVRNEIGKDVFLPVRGIAVWVVVFHHMAPFVGEEFPIVRLVGAESLAVAVFFFLSGYGLVKSLRRSREYLNGFVKRSACKLFFPMLVCLVFWMAYLAIKGEASMFGWVTDFLCYGNPPLPNSWYVFELFAFYVFFWLSFRRMSEWRAVLLCSALVFAMFVGFILTPGWKVQWWLTALTFPIGLLVALWERQVVKYRRTLSWVMCCALLMAWGVGSFFDIHSNAYNILRVCWHCCVGFSVALLFYCFTLRSVVLSYFGSISYDLYLVHGCFVFAFLQMAEHPLWYGVAVVSVSISAAILLNVIRTTCACYWRRGCRGLV